MAFVNGSISATVSEQMTKVMDERGIKGYQLAKAMGVQESTISKWKSGAMPEGASIESLIKLAKALHITLDYLVGMSEYLPDDDIMAITTIMDVFNLSPITSGDGIWSLRIAQPISDYLRDMKEVEEYRAKGLPEYVAELWVKDLQKKYKETLSQTGPGIMPFDEYDVYPKGYVQERERKLRLEYGRIPAPEAGDGNPVNRAKNNAPGRA